MLFYFIYLFKDFLAEPLNMHRRTQFQEHYLYFALQWYIRNTNINVWNAKWDKRVASFIVQDMESKKIGKVSHISQLTQ